VRCFIDFNRTCADDVQQSEGPRCRMWDPCKKDCILVELAKSYCEGMITYTTTFPESAAPPEVKG